ncbi:MAG TPA: nucleotidyltransferase family protein [Bacteroidota bacterium]|nr:nucleotidyltransferase family protein [Bacteroidota bacterium]
MHGPIAMNNNQVTSQIIPVLKNHGILKAALFGSVARGEATTTSDIDLLVQFSEGSSLLDLVGLKQELEELLRQKVDVVTYGSLDPLLRDSIIREQEVFYEAAPATIS